MSSSYTGRFAPSPTGALHLGSLLAAVASFLDARLHGGRWLLRVEDLDAPRVMQGSADDILRTLEAFALHWDGEVVYQSRRTDLYATALSHLSRSGLTFECSCSRKTLADQDEERYPGTCRRGPPPSGATATRFRIDETRSVTFADRIRGEVCDRLATLGDFVIRRRDGLFSYQLAVVVDDAAQGVTDVVRGADLLRSTAWQVELQRSLGLPGVRYAHVPLVVEPDGGKLAKSRRSVGLAREGASRQLGSVLAMLGIELPPELDGEPPSRLLHWAAAHWHLEAIRGRGSITAPGPSAT
ncbi:MAG: tRNA glutamyl-Q(34) synthetase GluQRS [Gammaproteobacteria bacterium]